MLYLHTVPRLVLKSHAPSISISSRPQRGIARRLAARASDFQAAEIRFTPTQLKRLAGDTGRLTRNAPRLSAEASKK